MRENAFRTPCDNAHGRGQELLPYEERRTDHRHSRPHSPPRRPSPRTGTIARAGRGTDGGVRPLPARRTQRGRVWTEMSTGVGRPGSADPDRGAAERTDSTERSRCGDHHGQAPSRSRADAMFAALEHYPHPHSGRNPFSGIRPELHSRTDSRPIGDTGRRHLRRHEIAPAPFGTGAISR